MHLMLHIFKKDLRRLWPAVLIMLVVMAELATGNLFSMGA